MTPDDTPAAPRPRPMTRDQLPQGMWSHRVTFRHGQCDPAGIVYTPKFFDVFNQAIEAWFCDCLGLNYYELIGERRTGLGYVHASASFFSPCRMGDEVDIFVRVVKIGKSSYSLVLHAMLGEGEALRGDYTTVTTSLETHRPIPIPEDIKTALTAYYNETQ
ncbi:acyl-CoA thioesterase [Pseudodonghicola flavimaris]|uniref:Thioesterase family protein n=1 Tax=Pseudodonghicola flavimaris TaxID=3050036 RepID=A0ABT7F2D1_9RHOB|nr:thioesterase family protein [Pseudodonghicola flavimaris]MDK3018747.1 thioesterase family protein [Pseudodonghicola flavimaris]